MSPGEKEQTCKSWVGQDGALQPVSSRAEAVDPRPLLLGHHEKVKKQVVVTIIPTLQMKKMKCGEVKALL